MHGVPILPYLPLPKKNRVGNIQIKFGKISNHQYHPVHGTIGTCREHKLVDEESWHGRSTASSSNGGVQGETHLIISSPLQSLCACVVLYVKSLEWEVLIYFVGIFVFEYKLLLRIGSCKHILDMISRYRNLAQNDTVKQNMYRVLRRPLRPPPYRSCTSLSFITFALFAYFKTAHSDNRLQRLHEASPVLLSSNLQ